MDHERPNLKEVTWVGNSKAKLKEFPEDVQKDVGDALFFAQAGSMSPAAKPFKGVGSGVFEIRASHRTDAYRAVYAVQIGKEFMCYTAFRKNPSAALKPPSTRWTLSKDA